MQNLATFEIKEGFIFTTQDHPDGQDLDPWYQIRENKIYPSPTHPQKSPIQYPWYEIVENKVYPTEFHPHGKENVPWFEIHD